MPCVACENNKILFAEKLKIQAVSNMTNAENMVTTYSILLKAKQIKKNFLREFAEFCGDTPTMVELADKLHNIIEYKGDFAGAIRMLNSFKCGTKCLPVDKYHSSPERQYIWKESAHGEYLWRPQLKRAHFRWNYGKRYTLTVDELIKVEEFLKKHGLNHL